MVVTLIHELVHLWVGAEGVSDWRLTDQASHSKEESFCNQVAVEVLVPKEPFLKKWNEQTGSLQEKAKVLCQDFKVSSVVIARRAWDSGFVNRAEFFSYYNDLRVIWKKARRRNSGGDFHHSFPIANSRTLTDAICHATYSGNLLMRDGARLLGVSPATLSRYVDKKGVL